MYGSIFKMTALPGKRDEVVETFLAWERDVAPRSASEITGYLLKSDANSDELIAVAIAPDEASYRANNDTPGQAEWYEKIRALLAADPEWNDGEIIKAE